MGQFLTILFLLTQLTTLAQSEWVITDYEWRNRTTYDKYIKPEQWINKIIKFKRDTISFDFSGIEDLETEIKYTDCKLMEPADTVFIKERAEFIFEHNLSQHLGGYQADIILIETRPNCYKFPFRNFILSDKKGFVEMKGVLFILTRK